MRIAIDFNDDHRLSRREVGDIASDNFLPAKFDAVETLGAKFESQADFRFGLFAAHLPGELDEPSVSHSSPSPNPLP
ncbi:MULTISPECIES: hypothetical protein [unclassified Sphingopyxis]|uniref:hypothetical protein n=1 Tax=unclassified Sphingopyxis TaxID=2614943 RepID=UPI0024ACD204|nr:MULTISPECIES: hypothetical protein [unclassified Sphingopyxis]